MPTTTEIVETLAAKTLRRVATVYAVVRNDERPMLSQMREIRSEIERGNYSGALALTRIAIQIAETSAPRLVLGLRRIETNLVSLSRMSATV